MREECRRQLMGMMVSNQHKSGITPRVMESVRKETAGRLLDNLDSKGERG